MRYDNTPSPYDSINDKEQLDRLAEELEFMEGDEWQYSKNHWDRLSSIYTRMLELDLDIRTRERIEQNLLHSLMQAGWHLKQTAQYEAAADYFQRILERFPNRLMPRVHYRLGFLFNELEDHLQAIHHFSKALSDHDQMNSFGRENEENPKLTRQQYFKSTIQFVAHSRKLSNEWFIKAQDLYELSERPDEETEESMLDLEDLVRQTEQFPYRKLTRTGTRSLTNGVSKRLSFGGEALFGLFVTRSYDDI
jgi:tetratricopeptide (TPR) repeat protein